MPSKLDDPTWRQERARKASAKAHSVETLVATLVRRAPELSEAQRAELRSLLAADSDGGR